MSGELLHKTLVCISVFATQKVVHMQYGGLPYQAALVQIVDEVGQSR